MQFIKINSILILSKIVESVPKPGLIQDLGSVIDSVVPIPSLGLAHTIKDLFSINVLKDIPGVFNTVPTRTLKKPTNIPYESAKEVKDNLDVAFISMCPSTVIAGINCFCPSRFFHPIVIKNRANNAFSAVVVEKAKRRIIVSYRFSVSYQNWLTNLDYTQVHLDRTPADVFVHRGFLDHYNSIRIETQNTALKLLKTGMFSNYTLHVTGFSLGGAIATISAPDWVDLLKSNNLNNKIKVFTYSAPRPGNEAFANHIANLHIPVHRYTYLNDLVPHVPIRKVNYVHAGVEFHDQFNKDTGAFELKVCSQNFDEDPACASGASKPYSAINHMLPFGKMIPMAPFCN